jgi:Glu-tRNA(Gln) amidotransferase subunit E-like FAD-binding protein
VIHALNETEAPCLVTTEEMMPRCESILKQVPSVKTVIYMDSKAKTPVEEIAKNLPSYVKVVSFSELVNMGRENPVEGKSATLSLTTAYKNITEVFKIKHFFELQISRLSQMTRRSSCTHLGAQVLLRVSYFLIIT